MGGDALAAPRACARARPSTQLRGTHASYDLYCTAMGEAKRKKEAALNGPCPCGSVKTARLCCFTGQGWQWHKPPAILGLKTLPPAGRVERCYMKELGSCVPPISGEHIISEAVCRVLM